MHITACWQVGQLLSRIDDLERENKTLKGMVLDVIKFGEYVYTEETAAAMKDANRSATKDSE